MPWARRSLVWPRPRPWHPRWSSWVPGRGSCEAPQQNPLGRTLLPWRGGLGLGWGPVPRPLWEPVRGSALPRALLARAASRHQPLRRGSLWAKGIFLWILLEASAAARSASPHPPESWLPPSPHQGAPRPEARTAAPSAPSSLAGPRAARHSPQGLDGTCPVSLPSSGARAAIRARLPAPPPPLSARRRGERQQVTRHLAKNTGSLRRAPAPVRTLRPPALQPASQPASH